MIAPEIIQKGKIFNKLDLEIMMRKADIRNLQMSIDTYYKMAGIYGPKSNLSIDYSRVYSSTPSIHISLDEASRLVDRDKKRINELKKEIIELRARKRDLIKVIKLFEGIEEQIFYYRVIMKKTQEATSEIVHLSTRQVQRIEKRMKPRMSNYDL